MQSTYICVRHVLHMCYTCVTHVAPRCGIYFATTVPNRTNATTAIVAMLTNEIKRLRTDSFSG